MEGKKLIHSIRLRNFLSYGEKGEEIKLEPLNVLIGRNASGKSNLIEAINLIHATPTNLSFPIQQGGGIREWIWKGGGESQNSYAEIEAVIDYPEGIMPLLYHIELDSIGQRHNILREVVQNQHPHNQNSTDIHVFYSSVGTAGILGIRRDHSQRAGVAENRETQEYFKSQAEQESSILFQRKDPLHFPEITYLGNVFSQIIVYEALDSSKSSYLRQPQKTDLPEDYLLEDASNLGLVLNDLQHRGFEKILIEQLQKFAPSIQEISLKIQGGTVQVFVREEGLTQPIPVTRLSDGTLRYLCLLTILCHPEPPPLICIEEPELGLHPDVLPDLAKLLIEASQRTQLIITTHSEALVSGLSEVPESVVVCERDKEGTHLRRLEPKKLKKWLEKYSLGDLWQMGEIGGN